ncbi:sigma-70 family RNA polymerase sigma factor [Haliangium ochraceum]|uniref:RNA polymerase, sigma 32 subunit, RpoH n=1 Tax=Haliangium ochraceum (strain DSM 14365 / JCM 11303 / SMP-2) TaxID=502025 RepID=D0LN81_HALO1|nr:sigma-70 family RNA polymerase sigma factor [Haliangium ochraceum]ACY15258.1 RNA polymerase, sigma 32 subunit, RpoH [Haliangium ochraceum DSM 14365]
MARYISEEPGFQTYVDSVERIAALEREEELALARRWREHGDRAAADALVSSQLRSVLKIARKYRGYGIYLSDLVAEGNLGLLEAVNRFEPERGLRFFTYARHWVRAFILAHVLKHWSIVDLGTTAQQSKMFFRLQSEHARLLTTLGDQSDQVERQLADTFKTSPEQVRANLQRLARRDASLDVPVVDGGITFLDMLQADTTDQETQTAAAELSSVVRNAVSELWPTLDCRERLIVDERLLPADGDPRTLAALGRQLGLTRERVRQLEAGVKDRLRAVLDRLLGGEVEHAQPAPLSAAA